MENEVEPKSSWFDAVFASRGAIRGIALISMLVAIYVSLGSIRQAHFLPESATAKCTQTALLSVLSINLILLLFAFCHALLPSDVSELRARCSGRGVMRCLSVTACGGCLLVSLYAGWGQGDWILARFAVVSMIATWVFFALVYGLYVSKVQSDRIASKCSINKLGTARRAIVSMAGMTVLGIILAGLSTGVALDLLFSLVFVGLTMLIFTFTMIVFEKKVEISDDRG